ncbi:DUF4358 domain-containing protein [Velocimicrobium porci]|uniref:DUF4358 domain-containing protein n=1 Tax=Velocimicrobium porci TaxID=2606634 RepID=UPI0012B2A9E8|nr:DUF4358 domain-containing protein [Velocimicrobium porci]
MKKRLFILGLISVLTVGVIPPANFTNHVVSTSVEVEAAAKNSSVTSLAKSVKKAYGEKYIPNVKLSKTEIKDKFLIDSNLYSSAYVEVPMISAHIDTLAIFKAKNESTKKKIVSKLKEYKKEQIEHTLQYPSNLLKLHASKIYTNGNYVCFIMLGQVNRSVEESGDESAIIKAYQKQNLVAVNAIKKALKK